MGVTLKVYTTKEAAVYLGIGERAVRRAADRGTLKHEWAAIDKHNQGRVFSEDDMIAYKAGQRRPAGPAPSPNATGWFRSLRRGLVARIAA